MSIERNVAFEYILFTIKDFLIASYTNMYIKYTYKVF